MDERVVRAEASIELAERHLHSGQVNLAFEAAREGGLIVERVGTPVAIRNAVEARLLAVQACIYLDDLGLAEEFARRALAGMDQIGTIRKRVEGEERERRFVAGRGLVRVDPDPDSELDDFLDSQLLHRCRIMLWKVREYQGDDRALKAFQELANRCLSDAATSPLGLLASRHVLSCSIYAGESVIGHKAMVAAFEASRGTRCAYTGEWFRWCAAFLISEGNLHSAEKYIELARGAEVAQGSIIGRIENKLVLAHLQYEYDHVSTAVELHDEALRMAANLRLNYLVGRAITSYT